MNKLSSFGTRFSRVTVLSLSLLVLGISSMTWVMFCVGGGWFNYFANPELRGDSGQTPPMAAVNSLTEEEVAMRTADVSWALTEPEKPLYPVYPVEGDSIGTLTIPILEKEIPILQGTGNKELKKGAGHFLQSVLPGEADNCVISGHRETVFRKLGELQLGDLLIVETTAGVFTYAVTGTRIVEADDRTVIIPIDHAVLTLTTCYPFDTPGYYPQRYIVSADLATGQ